MTASTSKTPVIDLVMTTYNRAELLPQAIESLLKQSLEDFHLIIVDDGSMDETQSVLKNYSKQDKRITTIQQSNSGLAAARNRGVKQARGEYLCFMDDDDISHPQRLEKQLAYLRQQPHIDACICNMALFHQEGKIKKEVKTHSSTRHNSNMMDVPCPWLVLNATTMMTRRSFQNMKGYRPFFHCAEDYDLSLRFQEQFNAGVVSETLYYRRNADGKETITNKNFINIMEEHLIAHISAWHRRSERKDPLDENKSSQEILALVSDMPASARAHLIVYIKRCIYNIRRYSPEEWTRQNIDAIRGLVDEIQLDSDGRKNSRILIMKLWLKYMAFHIKRKTI